MLTAISELLRNLNSSPSFAVYDLIVCELLKHSALWFPHLYMSMKIIIKPISIGFFQEIFSSA